MNAELFPTDTVTMDSPRLAWLKRHGVVTHRSNGTWRASFWTFAEDYPTLDEKTCSDPQAVEDFFFFETGAQGESRCGVGVTEDDACADLCKKADLRLWNEEGGA